MSGSGSRNLLEAVRFGCGKKGGLAGLCHTVWSRFDPFALNTFSRQIGLPFRRKAGTLHGCGLSAVTDGEFKRQNPSQTAQRQYSADDQDQNISCHHSQTWVDETGSRSRILPPNVLNSSTGPQGEETDLPCGKGPRTGFNSLYIVLAIEAGGQMPVKGRLFTDREPPLASRTDVLAGVSAKLFRKPSHIVNGFHRSRFIFILHAIFRGRGAAAI